MCLKNQTDRQTGNSYHKIEVEEEVFCLRTEVEEKETRHTDRQEVSVLRLNMRGNFVAVGMKLRKFTS